ncbi:ferritin-like domain-containing protein [Parasphingorhabdus cellanae]|uniref:Ferritin-like domain-containing protein n=1 Tax=Parasphingorhabdus cellanae TaxID=2806553 RepID=A0ABX7T8D3_9SPHN|nr:ferritin-like domain-containing protein [Parasphingorhabdus cellanae]QTD57908.1 ferritin-like domain-containing protein [Parasphingorhabdus cellanae]
MMTAEPAAKVMAARYATREWRKGRLEPDFAVAMPDVPARPDRPELLRPGQMPRRGKGTSVIKRIALIHALAHIEFVAIDLAFDMIGRFGAEFPREFADDWFRVGAEEAMHFVLLDRRLREMGSFYGDLPAHDGLWDTAKATAHDASARLAIVPMVLEARGLDITLDTVERFKAQGDPLTAKVLNRIYHDEINHVFFGTKWFEWCCNKRKCDPYRHWKDLVKTHFRGGLKPPFNDSARLAAGLTQEYYLGIE